MKDLCNFAEYLCQSRKNQGLHLQCYRGRTRSCGFLKHPAKRWPGWWVAFLNAPYRQCQHLPALIARSGICQTHRCRLWRSSVLSSPVLKPLPGRLPAHRQGALSESGCRDLLRNKIDQAFAHGCNINFWFGQGIVYRLLIGLIPVCRDQPCCEDFFL